jgi:hypothetical protein
MALDTRYRARSLGADDVGLVSADARCGGCRVAPEIRRRCGVRVTVTCGALRRRGHVDHTVDVTASGRDGRVVGCDDRAVAE